MTETFTAVMIDDDYYIYRQDDEVGLSFYVVSILMDLFKEDEEEFERIMEHVEDYLAQRRHRAEA